ncbi:GNAT family N-acetyltransferase [Kitasatospora sp. GP82]|uniref:GNAT family N-acetyltransferase n=1 Tax=Kitasatospora sp. GP82 TaxID=3035089 RepID=UPI0024768BE8|nr:GNAT family N-acetyltransferase [Kitasatospora sp. GP82]MDH6124926.1 N-acetylglutamate synthase-like GNAT family acetyltransferase [Kitasatospora sp. GP82]
MDTSAGSTHQPIPPSRAQRRIARTHRWRRDTTELAAVFSAVAVADLVANVVVHGHDGPVLLFASAAALLATAVCHAWWAHRHPHAPPAPDPGAPPGEDPVTGPLRDFEQTALWRIRATVSDAPGSLARVATALAGLQVNIVSMQAHPLPTATVDEFLVRAPRTLTRAELAAAIATAGGHDIWTDPADAHDLVDVPTHVLALATRTALDAAELPVALRQLFGRCTIRQYPDGGQQAAAGIDGHVMRLPVPSGDLIELTRPHLPFTPTEFARAQALVELDSLLGPRVPKVEARLSLPAGTDLTVRRADTHDKAAALAMHRRCSVDTLRKRYHGPVRDADKYLDHLLDPRHGQTLAVEAADGRIVALAHLMWDDDSAEVALLIEDDWQRRGLGVDLLRRMAALALEAGVQTVYAVTHASNTGLIATMRRLAAPLDYQVEEGTMVITAHLAEAAEQLPTPWPTGPGR